MSQVVQGTLGLGILGPGKHTTWVTNINPAGVWHFWANNTTLGYSPARVRIEFIDTVREGNAHYVEIHLWNPSASITTGFSLRWSMVFD